MSEYLLSFTDDAGLKMIYTRCARCEINFISADEDLCKVCKGEMAGSRFEDDDEPEELLCLYCEKRQVVYGEEMCASCLQKREKAAQTLS